MGLLSKISDFLRGNKGTGSVHTLEPQEGHVITLEDEVPTDQEIQTTFNEDSIDILVEEGVVENVNANED